MNNKLPNGAQFKIRYQGLIFKTMLFTDYLLGFDDCVSISPESREKAISDGIADIALESVSGEGVEIENIEDGKITSLPLGGTVVISSKKYGDIEITLLGVRIDADESNFDQWILAEDKA